MRSSTSILSLRKKRNPPSPCLEKTGQSRTHGANTQKDRKDSTLNYYGQQKIGHSERTPSVPQSPQTPKIIQNDSSNNELVEVNTVRNYKTADFDRPDLVGSPYGAYNFPTFGPQWGTAASRDTRNTGLSSETTETPICGPQYRKRGPGSAGHKETIYGKAAISLYGPQYGVPAISLEEDLYDNSEEEQQQESTKFKDKLCVTSTPLKETSRETSQQTWDEKSNVVGKKDRLDMILVETNEVKSWSPTVSEGLPELSDTSLSSAILKTVDNSMSPFTDPIETGRFSEINYPAGEINSIILPTTGPTSCIICTDEFSANLKAPGWITMLCAHEPSICCGCMAKCIKNDLESKLWSQITCPECKSLLIYDDIKRLADPETFTKYESLSFRNAIGKDENFVWCRNCDFGQLHISGQEQPIVRCMKCGFRSCFRHAVPWHDRLTCQEYDEMVDDPDGFKSAVDRDEEASRLALKHQHETDERLARELEAHDRQAEGDRQRAAHEEELRQARKAQEAAAEKKRLEQEEQERAKKREEIKLRKQQEELSLQTVKSTTKNCPGCQWPIEKNQGCSHMTCIRCHAEFCWSCLNDFEAIRKLGNSEHKTTCKFHTDNLPELDNGERSD